MQFQHLKNLIADANHILLLTDERIDGDTLGSTLGLFHALTESGKKVSVFSPKPLPPSLAFIPGVEHIIRNPDIFRDPSIDLLCICDCSDGVYLKNFLPLLKQPAPLVVFDHHATNPYYGTLNIIDEHAASTCDVVWSVLTTLKFPISATTAQCLLNGVCTDTVVFSTRNTTERALLAASDLVQKGADLQNSIHYTLNNKRIVTLKLLGLALSRLAYDPKIQAMTTGVTYNDILAFGGSEEDWSSSDVSCFINQVSEEHPEHEVMIIYTEKKDGTVRGSIRSRGRDISKLAAHWGGGGHKLASGFTAQNSQLTCIDGVWQIAPRTNHTMHLDAESFQKIRGGG